MELIAEIQKLKNIKFEKFLIKKNIYNELIKSFMSFRI